MLAIYLIIYSVYVDENFFNEIDVRFCVLIGR